MTLYTKYANRKIYNKSTSRYVTFKEVGEDIKKGNDVKVECNKTKKDITLKILNHILFTHGHSIFNKQQLVALITQIEDFNAPTLKEPKKKTKNKKLS